MRLWAGSTSSRRSRIGLRVADQSRGGLVQPARLLRVGVDADHLELLVHAPLAELDQHARAHAQHDVGFAPELVRERQRHAERIAAVEHAAAAAIAEHRRLQHGGERGDLGGRILRAAAADDHRVLRRAQKLRRLADRGLVELRPAHRQRRLRHDLAGLAPDVDRALQRGGPRPAFGHRAHRFGDEAGSLLGLADQRREIDEALEDAGLIADLVQMAEMLADVGVGNFADQRQHRRVHRIGGEQRRRGIEQPGTGHHGIGRGPAGRQRRAQRHVGRALFVAGVDHAHAVGDPKQRLEQEVVLHARQRVDRIDAVRDHSFRDCVSRGHGCGLGRGSRRGLLGSFFSGGLHANFLCYFSGSELIRIMAFSKSCGWPLPKVFSSTASILPVR